MQIAYYLAWLRLKQLHVVKMPHRYGNGPFARQADGVWTRPRCSLDGDGEPIGSTQAQNVEIT